MAPKGNKRVVSATGAAASPKKKGRVDPMFAEIIATLQGSCDLSENCREMLIAMAVPCLSVQKSARHNVQQLGVTMIGEMLEDHKSKLIEAVAVAQKELSDLEGSKTTIMQRVDEAKALLEEKRATKTAAHSAHEGANASLKVAENAHAEAMELQRNGDAAQALLQKEKADLDTAYLEHFKTPMDSNEGPHHEFLKPFIEHLGLEESLTSALPSSCVKTKEQRGGFDELVLAELGKALVAKIAALEKSLSEEASKFSERKDAVLSAQTALDAKHFGESGAAVDLENAIAAQSEAEEMLAKASKDWAAFEPEMQQATDNHHFHDTMRMDFEGGPLKNFETLRDKEAPVPVVEEAAPAGA